MKLPGRPVSITEQPTGKVVRITERFVYAGNTDAEKALNLAGVCVRHYDTAGLVLAGTSLSATRRLLKGADNPDVVADWQGTDGPAWNELQHAETYTTLARADATDAQGNLQRVAYDVAGLLSGNWLTLKEGPEQIIVKLLTYLVTGQKLREVHGNGTVTTYTYEAQMQRLTGIKMERPAGHASGARALQDLRYEYDPVGNVLKISNGAERTRFWRDHKVVPENTYVYDSLYQLVWATGREMASTGQQGSSLPTAPQTWTSCSRRATETAAAGAVPAGAGVTQHKSRWYGNGASGSHYCRGGGPGAALEERETGRYRQ
jgi:insecticidal toxin complex protein TccC